MPLSRTARVLSAALLSVSTLVSSAVGLSSSAHADSSLIVPEPPRPAFYEAPAVLPSANGALIRSEPIVMKTWGEFTAERILYKSTSRGTTPIAVSGSVLVPTKPWTGHGARPLIGFAPGTQGIADRCAPSRLFQEGFEYEGLMINPLLKAGYAVAVTDYEGLGTAGIHPYMVRESQAHTVLDAVRAAKALHPELAESPIGLQGFSQGGGGAAAAAELAASYAPELNVKGASVGAVPADLTKVAEFLDGGLWAIFGHYASLGITTSYGIDMAPYLNDRGKAMMTNIQSQCVFELLKGSFVWSEDLTADGYPMTEKLGREPFASIMEQQRIGKIAPKFPTLVTMAIWDDVIPYAQGRTMARNWCRGGGPVRLNTSPTYGHGGAMISYAGVTAPFWRDRFSGKPWRSNCGWF